MANKESFHETAKIYRNPKKERILYGFSNNMTLPKLWSKKYGFSCSNHSLFSNYTCNSSLLFTQTYSSLLSQFFIYISLSLSVIFHISLSYYVGISMTNNISACWYISFFFLRINSVHISYTFSPKLILVASEKNFQTHTFLR